MDIFNKKPKTITPWDGHKLYFIGEAAFYGLNIQFGEKDCRAALSLIEAFNRCDLIDPKMGYILRKGTMKEFKRDLKTMGMNLE